MAEATTIARPYAQAVFKLAQESGRFTEWSDVLGLAAAVVRDPQMQAITGNPKVPSDTLADLMINICGDKLDAQGKNLIKVLAENKRLPVLPEIAAEFETLRNEAQKTVKAEVVSAFAVSEDQKAKIASALKARLGCEVDIDCRQDESLIGGAIIRAGDMVIDGSVAGQLERLTSELSH